MPARLRRTTILTDPMIEDVVRITRRSLSLFLALSLSLAACARDGADTSSPTGVPVTQGLALAVASFDLAIGPSERLLVAVFTDERERVAGGEITFRLVHLGDQPSGQADPGPPIAATFLPIPGLDVPQPTEGPAVVGTDLLTGVYRADVNFDAPGFWGLLVEAKMVDGRVLGGQTVLRVLPTTQVIDVGEAAPLALNIVREDVDAGRAPASSLDSRLRSADERDPAAALHEVRIPDAIAAGRPVVVTIATPVYCVSLVCGPLTDFLVEIAGRFDDRADFVHIEVWEDFEQQVLNPAAAAWIRTETGGNEPWVFVVGADGMIVARWDNVIDATELTELLSSLPVLAGA